VFLSADTSQCGEARKLVASDLRSHRFEVKVQEDCRQEAGADATTLRKLHDCVTTCHGVRPAISAANTTLRKSWLRGAGPIRSDCTICLVRWLVLLPK
jgi:hypothetical protein